MLENCSVSYRRALGVKKSQPYKQCKIVDETNVVRTLVLIQHIWTLSKKPMFIKSQMPWFQNMMAKKVLKTSKNIVAEINDPGTDLPEHSGR